MEVVHVVRQSESVTVDLLTPGAYDPVVGMTFAALSFSLIFRQPDGVCDMVLSQSHLRADSERGRRPMLVPVFLALSLGLFAAPGRAEAEQLFDQDRAGIAIQGYDPVAYFTQGKAVKGSDAFSHQWLGATWYFANAEHRDLFTVDPVKYAPQYGGYCTSGIAGAGLHGADPKIWRIVDGKLYLNGSEYALKQFADSAPEGIEASDAKWKDLQASLTE